MGEETSNYYRDIVILANSRKNGGKCIAGKDIHTNEWIRVVPKNIIKAYSRDELRALCGYIYGPNLLRIYRIPFSYKMPLNYHPEDEYINNDRWTFKTLTLHFFRVS